PCPSPSRGARAIPASPVLTHRAPLLPAAPPCFPTRCLPAAPPCFPHSAASPQRRPASPQRLPASPQRPPVSPQRPPASPQPPRSPSCCRRPSAPGCSPGSAGPGAASPGSPGRPTRAASSPGKGPGRDNVAFASRVCARNTGQYGPEGNPALHPAAPEACSWR
uniref:Uncharacterized protein n=1 Tax=Chrysemys picta bellii TaxID=8478 RepID=A0A8C3FRB0_CHRPI